MVPQFSINLFRWFSFQYIKMLFVAECCFLKEINAHMRKCLETKGGDIQLHDWPSKLFLEKERAKQTL